MLLHLVCLCLCLYLLLMLITGFYAGLLLFILRFAAHSRRRSVVALSSSCCLSVLILLLPPFYQSSSWPADPDTAAILYDDIIKRMLDDVIRVRASLHRHRSSDPRFDADGLLNSIPDGFDGLQPLLAVASPLLLTQLLMLLYLPTLPGSLSGVPTVSCAAGCDLRSTAFSAAVVVHMTPSVLTLYS
jgi:hypothetical protein